MTKADPRARQGVEKTGQKTQGAKRGRGGESRDDRRLDGEPDGQERRIEVNARAANAIEVVRIAGVRLAKELAIDAALGVAPGQDGEGSSLGRKDAEASALLGEEADLSSFSIDAADDDVRVRMLGVPFGHWAALRIQNTMLDGVRRWENVPRRGRKELGARQGIRDEPNRRRSVRAGESTDPSIGSQRSVVTTETAAPVPSEGATGGGVAATPEEAVAKAELFAHVRRVIEHLPTTERELVKRHYFEGQSLDHAAAALNLGKSWASRLLARAIETVEHELREHDASWGE